MQVDRLQPALGALLAAAVLWPAAASAQASTAEELMALDKGQLQNEIDTRYNAALALTQDGTIVSSNSDRYMWASQAKAQCGIAHGFLRSGEKDPVSVGKCVDAYNRMQTQAVAAAPPPPAPAPDVCGEKVAGIVFFDFDSVVPASGLETVDAVVAKQRQCGWNGLAVTGHADRSGSDAFNLALSQRRAEAVAALMQGKGVDQSILEVAGRGEAEPRVPTADGERSPENRRVEITVK